FLGLRANSRWVLWSVLPIYLSLYCFFPFLLSHYAIVPAPAVVLGIVIGWHVLETLSPQRIRSGASMLPAIATAALVRRAFVEPAPEYLRPTMWFSEKVMSAQIQPP